MDRSELKRIGMGVACALAVVTAAAAASVGHAVVGSIEKIDDAAKTIAVRTVDGTTEVFRFTESTTVTGATTATHVADLAGKGSYHFVVHYTGTGQRKTASSLEFVGDGPWKVAKGAVVRVDGAGRTVVMKTADGAEQTFHAGEHAAVQTSGGVAKFGIDAGQSVAEGAELTAHYTEEGGKKVAHFFQAAGRRL